MSVIDFGIVKPGTDLFIPFNTFDSNDPSASVTTTGLATTDIEIYKDGSVTQRASDAGYALLDTDGIDFDGITGIHGFSVDLADNTTAGFYAAGSQYWIVVSSITVDAATVNFVAATFRIGYPDAILNTTIATLSTQTSFTLTSGPAENDAINDRMCVVHDVASGVQVGHAVVSDYVGSTKTVTLAAATTFTAAATDNISIMGLAPLQPTTAGATLDVTATGAAGIDWANVENPTTAVDLSGTDIQLCDTTTALTNAINAASIVASVSGNVDGSVGSVTGAVGSVAGHTAQTGDTYALANGAAGFVAIDTVVDAIKAVTDDWAEAGRLDLILDIIAVDTTTDIPALIATAQNDLDIITGAAGALLDTTATSPQLVDDVWDEVLTGATHNVSTSAGKRLRQIDVAFEVHSGTAEAGSTSTTINLEAATADNVTDEIYAGDRCVIVAGTGVGEHGLILSYASSTQIATMSKAWIITPDDTSEYILTPADVDVEMWNDNTVTSDGDWAALKAETALIVEDTNELQTDLADGGRLDLILDIIAVDTTTDIPALIAALNDVSTSDILTQVNSAIDTAISELGVAAPTATPTLRTGLMLMYMMARNRVDVDTTGTDAMKIYNDAGTQIASKLITDDGTDYSEAEMV